MLTIERYYGSGQSGVINSSSSHEPSQLDHEAYMKRLFFGDHQNRLLMIADTHANTCEWILDMDEYRQWVEVGEPRPRHDLLWMKGKPGAGKSTIMKFLQENVTAIYGEDDIVSFYFNARGANPLEHSAEGMYRSLIHQIISLRPSASEALSLPFNFWSCGEREKLQGLRQLSKRVLHHAGTGPLFIFIDALDECDNDMAQDIVDLLNDEMRSTTRLNCPTLRLCFASRHYPRVTARDCWSIIVEDVSRHQDDIRQYLQDRLDLPPGTLRAQIEDKMMAKCGGVFLWVELVTKNVNRHVRDGTLHCIMEILEHTPEHLKDLIRSIVKQRTPQDPIEYARLLLCMRLIMYSRKALELQEVYWALITQSQPSMINEWSSEVISRDVMEHFVLSSSRGLISFVPPASKHLHFIHESVPETLRSEAALQRLFEEDHEQYRCGDSLETCSHRILHRLCQTYLETCRIAEYWMSPHGVQNLKRYKFDTGHCTYRACLATTNRFPFVRYAVDYVFEHYTRARVADLSKKASHKHPHRLVESILEFPLLSWLWPYTILTEGKLIEHRHARGLSMYSRLFYDFRNPMPSTTDDGVGETPSDLMAGLVSLAEPAAPAIFKSQRLRSTELLRAIQESDIDKIGKIVLSGINTPIDDIAGAVLREASSLLQVTSPLSLHAEDIYNKMATQEEYITHNVRMKGQIQNLNNKEKRFWVFEAEERIAEYLEVMETRLRREEVARHCESLNKVQTIWTEILYTSTRYDVSEVSSASGTEYIFRTLDYFMR